MRREQYLRPNPLGNNILKQSPKHRVRTHKPSAVSELIRGVGMMEEQAGITLAVNCGVVGLVLEILRWQFTH